MAQFPPLRAFVPSGLAGLVMIGVVSYTVFAAVPAIRQTRERLDNDRASIALIRQQQSNLDVLSRNLSDIQTRQEAVDAEMWRFTAEDAFFTWFDQLMADHHLNSDLPVLADAVPGSTAVQRAATLTMTGKMNDVLAAVAKLQIHQPLMAVQRLTFTPAETGAQATIQALTLWR